MRLYYKFHRMIPSFITIAITVFVARWYVSAAYAVIQCVSVRPSVCHVYEFCQNENEAVEFSRARHKSRFWTNSWLSIDGCCSVRSTTDGCRCSVSCTVTVHVCLR